MINVEGGLGRSKGKYFEITQPGCVTQLQMSQTVVRNIQSRIKQAMCFWLFSRYQNFTSVKSTLTLQQV